MKAPRHDQEAGFTLLETVIMLAIAAMVFSIGAVGISSLKKRMTPLRLATDIAEAMNGAHVEARDRGVERSVTVDLKARMVRNPGADRDIAIPGNYALSVVVGRETVGDDKVVQIFFLPDGTSSGGEIAITSPEGVKARVDINWLTGLSKAGDAKP